MTSKLAPSKIALILLATLVVFAEPAAAGYDSALAAFEAGAYDEALREFERLARHGDDRARYHLGLMLKDGNGVAADPAVALVWFLCAATDAGEFVAQTSHWRDRLTANMNPLLAAAAARAARPCRRGAVSDRPSAVAIWSPGAGPSPDNVSSVPKASDLPKAVGVPKAFGESNPSPAQQRSGARRDGRASLPRNLWFRIFYFPAHASINGLEFLAESMEVQALKRDLRLMSGAKDSVVMGFFALVWWILIFRAVLRIGRDVRGTAVEVLPDGLGRAGAGAGGWRGR